MRPVRNLADPHRRSFDLFRSSEITGKWLDSWPTPFPSREAAAAFLGGGPVGAGWAAGLEERDDGFWPRFDRDVTVRSLAENAQPLTPGRTRSPSGGWRPAG